MRNVLNIAIFLAFSVPSRLGSASSPALPPTPKRPVTDTYHGVSVTDSYRWLENMDDPAVKQWSAGENAYARSVLDALPARNQLLKELREWDKHREFTYGAFVARPHIVFALRSDPSKQHPDLVTFPSLEDRSAERVLVDPDQIDRSKTTHIDFFVPSTDGRYVAVSLSSRGSEAGDVQVFTTADGKPVDGVVPRVNGGTAGGSVAWNADSSGFYYTRYPRGNERAPADMNFYQQVWFHRLGTSTDADSYALGKELPRIAETALSSSEDGRYIAATVENGDGGEYLQFLLAPGRGWRKLASYSDSVTQLAFGLHDDVYLLSKQNAPRGKVLHLKLDRSLSEAEIAAPQSEGVVEEFVATPDGLCVVEMLGGPSRVRYFPATAHAPVEVPLPPVSSASQLTRLGSGVLLLNIAGYLTPPAYFRLDLAGHKLDPTPFRVESPVSSAPYEVIRDFAVSKDGTRVPINIIRKKGMVLDGSHPALLSGYGGFNIAIQPHFSTAPFLLLERGFVVAQANLRGGSEFGEEWHEAGRLTRKQNVFDDFAGCARYLIDHGYTTASRLAIQGGSNGGLLMGAELTQHPDLYRVVVSSVGIYDMLRTELSPNGAFNVTEYGTVKEADQFRALYAYSPYHHVTAGTQYPAILFMTGDNDPRVDPMQSRKMTAALQASGSKQPVLLRTSGNSGHGASSKDEGYAQLADAYAFILHEVQADRP